MTNLHVPEIEVIPIGIWTCAEERDIRELDSDYFPLAFSPYFHTFGNLGDYNRALGLVTLGQGVAHELDQPYGYKNNLRAVGDWRYQNQGRVFSGGIFLLGATSHDVANDMYPDFIVNTNLALDQLEAPFRLETSDC